MALSKQTATVRQIAVAKQYLDANGFQLLESLPYTKVHDVHAKGSFHYDTQVHAGKKQSLAADVNWPGGGATERKKIIAVIPALQSMGISVLFARDGTVGSAAKHKTHAHIDVGEWTNLGKGATKTKRGDLVVHDSQLACHVSTKNRDNLDGPDTTKRLNAVKMASKKHGTKFPNGIKYTQQVIGAPLTGKWDKDSRAAHDATVKRLEAIWKEAGLFKGTVNTIWDAETDKALVAFHKKY